MSRDVRRVSLAQPTPPGPSNPAPPLLAPTGARVILGRQTGQAADEPLTADTRSLFAPRGACQTADGRLWVADTGHHRLLAWPTWPQSDAQPANLLIGQPEFGAEARNARGRPGAATLNVPTGVCAVGDGLAVADAWNHRVLIWHQAPSRHQQPADLVLGQDNFLTCEANRGRSTATADSLYWPYGVAFDGTALWISDSGNRRVLRWSSLPDANGQPADLVLGQFSFQCRDENAGGAATRSSMRWPHQLHASPQELLIADAGNNRVMRWSSPPQQLGAPCDEIIGQAHPAQVDSNRSRDAPAADSLSMPYGLVRHGQKMIIADTANSRILAWPLTRPIPAEASHLTGQPGWKLRGDNRWGQPSRDSLCWPYGLAVGNDELIIADSGNNRVLLWPRDTACRS